ncbi:hypothetical protein RHODOSMS8_02448 [Rhodobiaceae bacterium]|nr:hypothetical protein RHODOSMS8_02448 [Rhodobiaceae bacterium]
MTDWSLPVLFKGLSDTIQRKLEVTRQTIGHPGSKGDASEKVWLDLFRQYLPQRYQAEAAHVVDSEGNFSEQIDVLIFDRQYSPFIFQHEGTYVVPAESVYAVFEAKQTMNAGLVEYAQKKVASVRRLKRTSLPIPYAGGIYRPKTPINILGGLLTLESDWKPPLGESLQKSLSGDQEDGRLDMVCVSSHGFAMYDGGLGKYSVTENGKPATGFLFRLISKLQFCGTVPMIDVDAYSKWLDVG